LSLLEICTETLSGVHAATAGGAQRIELCSALELDGLSPSEELITAARAATDLELLIMVRPNPGAFVVNSATLQTMCAQIQRAHALGVDGFVCGCLLPNHQIDLPTLQQLVAASDGLPVTFHRAFDLAPDPLVACDSLIANGVKRILTAGGAATAVEGAAVLQTLVAHASQRIEIVVGGAVRVGNIQQLRDLTGAHSFHSALDRAPTVLAVLELATAAAAIG